MNEKIYTIEEINEEAKVAYGKELESVDCMKDTFAIVSKRIELDDLANDKKIAQLANEFLEKEKKDKPEFYAMIDESVYLLDAMNYFISEFEISIIIYRENK